MKTHATLATLALTTLSLHALDWPQYRGVTSDGKTTEKIAKPWPAAGPIARCA